MYYAFESGFNWHNVEQFVVYVVVPATRFTEALLDKDFLNADAIGTVYYFL